MTRLLVSGDSWTSCWPLEERLGHRRLGWPSLVSQHFGFELIDKSRAGSSNYRIYRKAFDGLLEGADLILVFLSSWARFETGVNFGEKPGTIHQHISTNKNASEMFKLFFNGYKNYTDMLRQIISLQSLSFSHQVPCFFLDTFEHNLYRNISIDQFKNVLKYNIVVFDSINDERIDNKFTKVKMLESNIDWSKFISNDSFQRLIRGCKIESGHPVEDGHAKIAGIVVNFLESANYGSTL